MASGVVSRFIESNIVGKCPNFYAESTSSALSGYMKAAKELDVRVERDERIHYFYSIKGDLIGKTIGLRPSLVSTPAWRTTANKVETLRTLEEAEIQPNRVIHAAPVEDFNGFLDGWKKLGSPQNLVVKPSHGQGGGGVTVGASTEQELREAWHHAAQNAVSRGDIVVEPFFSGLDLRVVVVNGRAVCSTVRLPPYIVGDGKNSMSDLVTIKNKLRTIHPHHRRYPVPLRLLEGLNKRRVPPFGEVYLLSRVANIHLGGEAIDYTDRTPPHILRAAERATTAIEGLGCAGVDLMTDDSGDWNILEMNVASNFGIHYYPMFGIPRNPAKEVLAEMLKAGPE